MATQATYDDVNLILKLYDLRREAKMREARKWFISSFKARTMDELNALCPMGSEENAYYRMVVTYWDMAASFVTGGVLNDTLFFQDCREALYVWERVRDVLPSVRATFKDPTYLKNLESVSQAFIQYLNSQNLEIYPVFSERVRAIFK